MTDHQRWAAILRDSASDEGVEVIINAINSAIDNAAPRRNRATVIVACTQILAQDIVGAKDHGGTMRAAIIALIDGFAMQVAVENG